MTSRRLIGGTMTKIEKAQRYNKGIAAAAVTVAAWVSGLIGLEVPVEVQGSLITLLVLVIPNRAA